MKIKNTTYLSALLLLIAAAILCYITGRQFRDMHLNDVFFPSEGLTEKKNLSDYFSDLKDTPGDSEVYIFKGKSEGGNLLLVGGTHPNEPAGFITALLLVETIRVHKGKILIIPQANKSAFTHNDPFEGNPQRFSIDTPSGKRWFRFGSRLTNPTHQWPDPALYTNPSRQKLAGTESRNLNRCYPGKKNGSLTEKIAFGIIELMKKEKIDLAVDLHEAAPEYPVINALVFHENTAELAAMALMEAQLHEVELRLEASPPNLRGLSHREWGDAIQVMAVLHETANVSHGRLKGKPTSELIITGKDNNYVKAAKLGRLFVPFDENGIPLKQRVFRHLVVIKSLLKSMEDLYPEKAIRINGYPDAEGVRKEGIGSFLKPLK